MPVLNSENRTTATHMPLPKPPPDQPDTKRDPQAPARDARTDAMETVFTTTNVELGGRTEVEVDLGGGSDDIFVLPDPSPTATDPVIPPGWRVPSASRPNG